MASVAEIVPKVPEPATTSTPCMVDAIRDGLSEALATEPRALLLGCEVGELGGLYRATAGLLATYGPGRVVELPAVADAEEALVGLAIGLAVAGRRPIVELQFADGLFGAFEQLVNELAKLRYRSGGQLAAPVVLRVPYGAGVQGGPYHSQSPEAYLAHTAGLRVVVPSTAADAKGLVLAAVASHDPVVILEPKALYRSVHGEVPPGRAPAPLEGARVVRPGRHATLVAYGAMVPLALAAAGEVERRGLDVEVLDLRALVPFDRATALTSVAKTGRLCIVHEAPATGGFGGEVAAQIAEHGIFHLAAPILRIAGLDTPVPYRTETAVLPTVDKVVDALVHVCAY
jgi:2-oxoisovalerate dehydrogenase E1 component beta subunit